MKKFFCLLFIGIFVIQARAQPPHALQDSLTVYATLTGKTILQPSQLPTLKNSKFSQFPTNKADAMIFIENEFGQVGYELIPAGEKFVQVISAQVRTNVLFAAQLSRFQPPALNTNSSGAGGTIDFKNVPISEVLRFYSILRHCQIVEPEPLPNVHITLRTQQALSREEVIYALNITMILNGIAPVDGEGENVLVVLLN
jgi:hypothetical protein